MTGRSLHQAIAVALEVLVVEEFLASDQGREALRAHVLLWVHDYAHTHGLILNDDEIAAALDEVLAARGGSQCV